MAGTSRRIGYFTATSLLIFLLIVLLVVPVNITFSSQTVGGEQFPQSIIAASGTDTTPHALELRAIQDGDNAEPRKVSGFKLDMTNVVAAQRNSQVLVFVTDSSVKVVEAKVRTVSDQLIDLVPSTQANAFSLANLPVGVYTLDVMTQKGNTKAAYEGILVISQQPTTVISETTRNIINQEINQNTRVEIEEEEEELTPICPHDGYAKLIESDTGCSEQPETLPPVEIGEGEEEETGETEPETGEEESGEETAEEEEESNEEESNEEEEESASSEGSGSESGEPEPLHGNDEGQNTN